MLNIFNLSFKDLKNIRYFISKFIYLTKTGIILDMKYLYNYCTVS